jgi:hypothetical protein
MYYVFADEHTHLNDTENACVATEASTLGLCFG